MVLKIADFFVKITNMQISFAEYCKDYICENPPYIDFTTTITEEDITYERKIAGYDNSISSKFYASNALFRKICAYALEKEAFMMHGAVIEYEGKGYLFTAQSGMGKTTHILLWKKIFGDGKVTIVNGDKPIIRFIDGRVYAYGTPWCGKEGYGINGSVELSGICYLERGEDNSIRKISDIEALPRLLSQIMIHDSANLGKQLELVDKLFEKVPMYLLKCNMNEDAAQVAFEGMRGSAE